MPIHIVHFDPNGIWLTRPVDAQKLETLAGWWPDGSLLETQGHGRPGEPPQDEFWRLPVNRDLAERLGVSGTNIFYASVTSDASRIASCTQTFGNRALVLKPARVH